MTEKSNIPEHLRAARQEGQEGGGAEEGKIWLQTQVTEFLPKKHPAVEGDDTTYDWSAWSYRSECEYNSDWSGCGAKD